MAGCTPMMRSSRTSAASAPSATASAAGCSSTTSTWSTLISRVRMRFTSLRSATSASIEVISSCWLRYQLITSPCRMPPSVGPSAVSSPSARSCPRR
eukprot:scaffold85229_cov63-Phaeocystis_antarctica.AAC.1